MRGGGYPLPKPFPRKRRAACVPASGDSQPVDAWPSASRALAPAPAATPCLTASRRLLLELKLPPTDAYHKLRHTIEEVNTLIATHYGDDEQHLVRPLSLLPRPLPADSMLVLAALCCTADSRAVVSAVLLNSCVCYPARR